jgi:pyruvate dehydrogenase E2 component (dihydrolipoamide acetyltransferase)
LAKEIIMPKFGFTQEESEILEWLHAEGDQVEKGDPVAVVTTDKISMEVEAPEDGILGGIRYQVGDNVPVTHVIAFILQPGESVPEIVPDKRIPEKVDTAVAEKRTDIQVTPVAQKLMDENQLEVDEIVSFAGESKITRTTVEAYISANSHAKTGKARATPAARRLGRDHDLKLAAISGSGPKARIQAADVAQAVTGKKKEAITPALQKKTVPLNNIRKTIARNMLQSWQEIPQMTLQADIPVSRLEAYRATLNQSISQKSKKITVTALITKAVAKALQKNPILNSQFDGDKIQMLDEINIGVATALDDGLIVPVVHHTDKKSIGTISDEIRDLSERARSGKLQADDLSNGTFTISNLGMFEIDRFTAIINPPQAAILAVGKKNRVFQPAEDNSFHVEDIITFTLSADHRVMDGAQAAKFMGDLKSILQNAEEL